MSKTEQGSNSDEEVSPQVDDQLDNIDVIHKLSLIED